MSGKCRAKFLASKNLIKITHKNFYQVIITHKGGYMSDQDMQKAINKEIDNWRKSEENEPLIIEFDNGEKFIFLKPAA